MKYILCFYIALLFAGTASAQRNEETQTQYRTDISIKDQLKGTAIPNQQYRTAGTKSPQQPAGNQAHQSLGQQIKNNTAPGKIYKKTDSKGAATPASSSGHALPSDKKAAPLKQQPSPEMPKNLTQ